MGRWTNAVESLAADMRYGARTLRRSPAFTFAAVSTLAIGIAGVTTVFSVVNALLLRPPAHVRAPGELVSLFTSDFSGPPFGSSSYPDVEEVGRQRAVFSGVAAFAPQPVGIGEGDALERTAVEMVTPGYFGVLGIEPRHGRFFLPDEGRMGAPVAVVVLGHTLWQRRYAADPGVVGRIIELNGASFTVIGVAPAGFAGSFRGLAVDAWVPLAAAPLVGGGDGDMTNRGNRGLLVTARLAPGVGIAQAQAAMRTLARNLAASHPEPWVDVSGSGRRLTVVPERDSRVPPQVRGPVLGFMGLLMGTVALVLLVCCANVASLMLARATRRSREMGVRLSLGASRRRVVRQLLTESALVALAGGLAGVLLTILATQAIAAFQPPLPVRIGLDLGIDVRVLAVALTASLATGVLFGLAPALRSTRAQVVGMMKADAPVVQVSGKRVSLQGALVVGQVAASLLLLVTALFFLRSLRAAGAIDPGFSTEGVLIFDADPRPDLTGPIDRAQVGLRIQERVAALPGVTSATWGMLAPLGLGASRQHYTIEGYQPAQGEDMEFHYNRVGPGWFETLRIPVVRGRAFTRADRVGAPGVVMVNEAFARRYWPGADPVGRRISVGSGPPLEVVGVTRDGKYLSLTGETLPYVFLPALQSPGSTVFHLRASGDPMSLRDAVRREVEDAAPGWQVTNVRSMTTQLGLSLAPQRIAGGMLSLFGAVALLLAAIGLYGVVAYSVASRMREFGVRIALGARASDVVRLVLRQGGALVLAGVAIGLPAGLAVSRLVGAFLIGRNATSVVSYAGAALLLGVVALVASWIPARRAARVHPMNALRAD